MSGVPQGSVLGPMLILIFINDLGKCIKMSNYMLYADDTVVYSQGEVDINTLHTNHQNDLTRVQTWCMKNAILMNVKKTKSMVFGMRHHIKNLPPPNFFLMEMYWKWFLTINILVQL